MRSDALEGGLASLNVVFCSTSVGCGHTRASVAVHDALRARGQLEGATFVEALEHAPRWFAGFYRDGYLRAIRHAPRVVGAIYDRTDVGRRDRRPLGAVLDRGEDRVMRRFREHPALASADVVVSTHFMTTAVLGRMRQRGDLRAPLVTIVTDEHPHSVWLHPGCDLTCVASAAARTAAIAGGLEPARVEVTGIPIDPRFCMSSPAPFGTGGARPPMILVAGGGHGLGEIEEVVASLLRSLTNAVVVVVCGKNAALERAMRAIAGARPVDASVELRVLGYTNVMHELMAAADVMVGKPGGLSSTEARAVGLPMVLLRPIPGQEERNADMLVRIGAAVRSDRARDAGPTVAGILADPARHWAMRASASASGRPRAAFDVASRIGTLARAGSARRPAADDRVLGRIGA